MIKLELESNTYNIPEGPDDLSLEKYIDVAFEIAKLSGATLTNDTIINIVCISCGMDREILENKPVTFFGLLVEKVNWLFNFKIESLPINDSITIEGQVYSFDKNADLTLKEWGDIDYILKKFDNKDKTPGLLCVRLRKKLERKTEEGKLEYYIENYESEYIEERIKLFKQQSMASILPIANFFLSREKLSQASLAIYSNQILLLNLNIQTLQESVKNGVGTTLYARLREKTFSKLMKFSKKELESHSHIYQELSKSQWRSERTLNLLNSEPKQELDKNENELNPFNV